MQINLRSRHDRPPCHAIPQCVEFEVSAVISECGKYRYSLERGMPGFRAMHWIMLNPSTADANTDDPTIRKCVGFARHHGCARITVHNLFAVRATDPREMLKHSDPVGPENWMHVEKMLKGASIANERVICAWGSHGKFMDQDETVMGWIENANIKPLCFGYCSNGTPRHPLMLAYSTPMAMYKGRLKCAP
jgi:hypothetical protein